MNKSLLIFSLLISYTLSSDCTCPSSATVPQTIVNTKTSSTSSELVVDGVNYGKLATAGDLLYLVNAVDMDAGIESLSPSCPTGYRLPTKEEYVSLLSSLGSKAYSTLKTNFVSGKVYWTSTKAYPSNTDGTQNDAWAFYALVLSGKSYKVTAYDSYTAIYYESNKSFARCILDTSNVEFSVDGLTNDLVVGEARTLTLDTSSFLGFVWRFNNVVYTDSSISVTATEKGCKLLEIWANVLSGKTVYSCQVVNANEKMGSDVAAEFNLDKVSILSNTFSSARTNQIHFERPQAPVAPKSDGGYYMAYNDYSSGYCKVVEFDSSDNVVKTYTLSEQAYPLDIIETDSGAALYLRSKSDSNYAYLVIYDSSFNQLSKTTIMNNGKNGSERSDALTFSSSSYGTDTMYEPHGGKLAYGKERVNLIFAHYNLFDGEGHTGDTYYSFDVNGDSSKTKYAWDWQSSHSLIQAHLYDGKYFVSAALGDAYPQGISLNVIDVSTQGWNSDQISDTNDQDICGTIEGNGWGGSMGRLGGLINLGSQKYAVVYSVKKGSSSTTNGIFVTIFKYASSALTKVNTYTVLSDAGKIRNLRAAKYGSRILILYVETPKDLGTDYPGYYLEYTETLSYLLVDTSGQVVAGPYSASTQVAPLNEDIRCLKDGSLRWGYVDASNVLRVVKVAAP